MKNVNVLAIVGLFLLLIVVGTIGKGISVYNTHIGYKTQIEAKQESNKAVFDSMWKKINQTVQVSDKYKEGLKEVLGAYTLGRKKESNQLLVDWTKEAIPTFDSSIYKQINNIIVGSRDDFTKNQTILLDLARQDRLLLQQFPNNIYASILNLETPKVQIVTSKETNKAFESGVENNIKL